MRLDWGCGPEHHDGWVHSDAFPWGDHLDHVGDVLDGLPWPDATFECIVSHHALQALPWPSTVMALQELRRVLVPGGVLRVSVPDLIAAVHAYGFGAAGHFGVSDENARSLAGKFCTYLTQNGATRSVFTASWLSEQLDDAGFAGRVRVPFGTTALGPPGIAELDTRRHESLIMEARK